MYLLKIKPEQMTSLYYLREYLKEKGYRATISGLVREMINEGLKHYEKEVKAGDCLISEKEMKLNELSKQYARKKIAMAKRKMNPERLKLIEKLNGICDNCGSNLLDGECEKCGVID